MSYAVVVPTVGRDTLADLLSSLAEAEGPPPHEVVVVNDRPGRQLDVTAPPTLAARMRVLASGGRGPAAARNVGWRATTAPWVVFVDDDVVLDRHWRADLVDDLASVADGVAAVQGQLTVPGPAGRRPTDWERNVAGLAHAAWVTADIAYRRDVLAEVGGFDERFRLAYREDSELAARVAAHGHRLVRGRRRATHPVRPASAWVSVARQRGNADDALLRRLYGRGWRQRVGVPRGRRPWHAAVTASGTDALVALALGRRRLAAVAALAWLAGTADFAARRIAPGPKTPKEVGAMIATSVLIPPVATLHWLRGWLAHRGATPVSRAREGGIG